MGRSVAGLYFANTLGASLGAFLAVGLLFGRLGITGTVRTAAAVNVLLGLAVLVLGRRTSGAR